MLQLVRMLLDARLIITLQALALHYMMITGVVWAIHALFVK